MKTQILVCVQQRHAPNPVCCANHGSLELAGLLREEIAAAGVAAEVIVSGCLGLCLRGPNIKALPDGRVWHQVQKKDIADVVSYVSNVSTP